MVYYREWSMEQEENNHKTSSTGKVKDGRETTHREKNKNKTGGLF